MGVVSLFVCLFKFFIVTSILAVLLVSIPGLHPNVDITKPYKVTTRPLEGKLSLNTKLNNVEIIHKGELLGPESFAELNGVLYTTLATGEVVALKGNKIYPLVQFGKPCNKLHEESVCGRPLGMRFHHNGDLYIADGYYGIFIVDVKTGEKKQIISIEEEINGKVPKLPNSLAVACNGDVFWSDSTANFQLNDGIFDILADGSGRLIHYDSRTKKNTVLIDGIQFANGVVLSEKEDFVLVAETPRNRILRYHLKGEKKGTHDVFIDGLPGLPDNLQTDGGSGFLVPIVFGIDADHPHIIQILGEFPLIRKFLARLMGTVQQGFSSADQLYPHDIFKRAVYMVGHFHYTSSYLSSHRTTILHVSNSGQILDSIHSNNSLSAICEVLISKNTLYLGSPFNDYLARIPLEKVGWSHLQQDVDLHVLKKRSCVGVLEKAGAETKNTAPPQAKKETVKQTTTPPPPKPTTKTAPKPTTPPPTPSPSTQTVPKSTAPPPTPSPSTTAVPKPTTPPATASPSTKTVPKPTTPPPTPSPSTKTVPESNTPPPTPKPNTLPPKSTPQIKPAVQNQNPTKAHPTNTGGQAQKPVAETGKVVDNTQKTIPPKPTETN